MKGNPVKDCITMKKRIIVSVTNDLYTDQRVAKVCRFLVNEGFSVLLVGRLLPNSQAMPELPYETKRMKLFFKRGPLFYAEYNLRLFFFLFFRRANVLLANDLDTLLANYLASWFKPKVQLVYDSHEYFTEVPELQGRKAKKVWEAIEGFIFPKLKNIYTVNQSIADLYHTKYGKTLRVVRNISPLWKPNTIASKEELGLPTDKPIIIIQGAGINVDRGAEEAVEAMREINDAYLIFVGDGDVIPQLKIRVNELNLADKVLFYGKKPYQTLLQYTYHSSIGLTLDKDTNLNYKYSLPNKVFDYIHTNTAIIATDLVEIKRVVETHQVGIILPQLTVEELRAAIIKLLKDADQLQTYQANCNAVKNQLCWENEESVLREIYRPLM